DAVAPPANSYWSSQIPNTPAVPQLYDDPDYAPLPDSAVGTSCTSPMTMNGVNQTYYCQFEYDITTFYNASAPVDSGIGGTTKQFNDVVVAWPPTNVPGNTQLPLLNANSAPDNSSVTFGSGTGVGFTITLTNNGVTTATGILLSDPLPSGAGANWSLASGPSGFGCGISGTAPNQSLTCTSPLSIAPGSGNALVFHLTSPTPAAGTYSNVATFTIGTQQTLAVSTFTVQSLSPAFSNLASYTIAYGQSTQTITGTISAGSSYPPAGETVTVTIASTSGPATITGTNGAFSVAFPTAAIPASVTSYPITYAYAGDGNFSSVANSNTSTLTVNKANQVITFPAPASPATYNTTFTVSASSTSGLTVSIGASGGCMISNGTVTMTSGTVACSLTASQTGNSNYNPATSVVRTVTAALASQTITFTTNAPSSAPDNSSFMVAATASSGLTVAFTSSGACTNSGATYTITASSGTCSVIANQAGNGNYSQAPTKTESTTATAATGSTLKFAPASLNFGTVYEGGTAFQTLTITNSGTSMVTFTNFSVGAISGDDSSGFLGIELCPHTLNAGKSCTIIMSFTADSNVSKTHAANLVIADNASGSPQSILMSATVINPVASLNPTSLNFGTQKSGTTSGTKLVTLKNAGTTNLTVSNITLSGNFAAGTGGTCTNTTSLGPNGTCTIAVEFKPASKGSKSGSVTITDNAKNSPQSVSLSGTGN
ncbi:MAG: choice-of-anchor D domain-containing protein, partial [Bryobacteraceae bacterium]